ncbi:MAG: FliB family protein [Clostridiales bacterium]|nr:FliB family protein [Clostridiales bacterium]
MIKNVKKMNPLYLEEFKCIGGSCKDSCCIGWDIDIDKITFKQYYKVDNKEMKRLFQKNLYINESCETSKIDYGRVKLNKDKRCAFLDDKNLCMIHSNLGEEYLSNVCTSFPRITNIIDGIYETSLDVACPEAARIILLKEEGIKTKESIGDLGKHIVSSEVSTNASEFKNSPIKYYKEIRNISINILQNRKIKLSSRIYILGSFLYNLEEEFNISMNNGLKYIQNFNINEVKDFDDSNLLRYIIQMDFFQKMLGFLDVFKEVDSTTFREYTSELINGFKINEETDISKNSNFYIKAFEKYNEDYLYKFSYIFENYLVNFIYNNMFPFSETESMFDGYIMLLARYSFIRFYLVGRYTNNNRESKESIVDFIQSFSKTVEHHKTYLFDSLGYIKENEFDNMEFAKLLL